MDLTNFICVFVFAFIVEGFVQSTVKPPPVQYRRDYIYLDEFSEFVKVNLKKKTWHQAKAYCEAEGGSLAVIRTAVEAAALKKLLETVPENGRIVWIGLQDLISEGEFETIDGQPISEVFGEWEVGEPNDAGGHEDCVLFTTAGKLNDDTCTEKRSFLCKKDANLVTPNNACDNFDLEYKPVLEDRQCIKFHKDPKTWEDAYATCVAEQGHLAIINSQEEADVYKSELAKYPASSLRGNFNKDLVLVGFHDKFVEGDYITVDNQKLSDSGYDSWADGQPDNRDNDENCGSMYRDGKLNDIGCNVRAMFICERSLTDPFDVSLNSRMDKLIN